jgi:purine-binding chemotaxis protein CheW
MESIKLVIFEANGEEYGIPVEHVVSIEKTGMINPLPEMAVYLKGLMKVREQLIPVLDSKQILFNNPTQTTEKTRLILVQTETLTAGLLVEDAREILDVKHESIQPLTILASQISYVSGMVNLPNRLIAVLEPRILLESLDQVERLIDNIEKFVANN